MEPKQRKRVYRGSEDDFDGPLSKKQRDQKKKQLFMQQFEKAAQEKIREMELKVEQLLATVDRAFRVELMKIPPQLQGTLMKDLMRENDEAPGEVTMAIKAESSEMQLSGQGASTLTRKTSKRVQAKETATRRKRLLSTQNKTPTMVPKTVPKSRSLVALKRSASKSLRSSPAGVSKAEDLVAVSNGQKRSTDSPASVNPLFATATVLTSQGEALHLSDAMKDNIDVDMLDDTAVHQMRKLMQLMDYLCNKAKVNNQ